MSEKYTKHEVKKALIEELIYAYGGLSQDACGNQINTPYMVLGIFEAAWERMPIQPNEKTEQKNLGA
jgi:hypothetical protein